MSELIETAQSGLTGPPDNVTLSNDMRIGTLPIDNELLAYELREVDSVGGFVVFLHGAGTATMERYTRLADEVAAAGVNVLTFDFSGHGKSTGTLQELSLARRRIQATEIIKELCGRRNPLVLAGFSMSGQTVCDIASSSELEVDSIFLGCPAAYRPDVFHLPFGDPEFTRLIREEGSWSSSSAFDVVRNFVGDITFLIPDRDEVIPVDVTRTFLDRANPSRKALTLKGCHHRIAAWLDEEPETRDQIVSLLANAGRSAST